jgi:hypothetical protein
MRQKTLIYTQELQDFNSNYLILNNHLYLDCNLTIKPKDILNTSYLYSVKKVIIENNKDNMPISELQKQYITLKNKLYEQSKKEITKNINKIILELLYKKPIQEIENKFIQDKNRFYLITERIINIKYDKKNLINFSLLFPFYTAYKTEDLAIYKYMYKSEEYADISTGFILKKLYKLNKICRAEYKTALHRIKDNNIKTESGFYNFFFLNNYYKGITEYKRLIGFQRIKPKEHICSLIIAYLKTFKSHKSKSCISALIRKEDKRAFLRLKYGNNPYKVYIKSRFKSHINHIEKLKLIDYEFSIKFLNCNKYRIVKKNPFMLKL